MTVARSSSPNSLDLLHVRVIVVAPITFVITQKETRTICNAKLIAIFARLEKFKGPIMQGCEILSFHWIKETVQIIIVRHMNISEQLTIRECMRPSFEGSVNMDL